MTLTIHSITDGGPNETVVEDRSTPQPSSEVATVKPKGKQRKQDSDGKRSPARSQSRNAVKAKALTKSEMVLKCLKRKRGVTLADLMATTGWQAHSVRGFLSATVRKKLGMALLAEKGGDGLLRYRIES